MLFIIKKIKMKVINNIFAALTIINQLTIDNTKIINYVKKIKKNNKGVVISNIGGWQSPNLDLHEKTFTDLNKKIIETSIEFIKNCEFKPGNFSILNMWANINEYKDFNNLHLHQNSFISGVYYLQTPKDCGNLVFKHPCSHLEYDWSSSNFKHHNEYNSPLYNFIPKKGDLILFPSWLEHYVEPNLNKKEQRISIAFNISV
jgi:uncharacterized protein (TIGR02466 family)